MAAYPTLNTQETSRIDVEAGYEPVRATNGSLKVRRMFSADKASFTLDHDLTSAQKSTLDSFYASNKDLDVTYTWPGTGASYTVRFVAAPQYVWHPWGFRARVMLVEV